MEPSDESESVKDKPENDRMSKPIDKNDPSADQENEGIKALANQLANAESKKPQSILPKFL